MPLVDDIARLRRESCSALDRSHDYYVHTKRAWRIVQQLAWRGYTFTVRNQATGRVVDESELADLPLQYVPRYLAPATFQHFVSLFEQFVFQFVRLWLTEYPGSLSGKQVEFRTVLDSDGKDEIVATVVDRELQGLGYQRVADWFGYVERLTRLGFPGPEEIERLAEIKASRDVLVHNDGTANAVYVDKSMGRARYAPGERLELPEPYHRQSWELVRDVVTRLADEAIGKLST